MKSIKDELLEVIREVSESTGSPMFSVSVVIGLVVLFALICGAISNAVISLLTLGEFAFTGMHTLYSAIAFVAPILFWEFLPDMDDDPKDGKREKTKVS